MKIPGDVMNFKRDHPHNYWARVVCLAFSMVFIAMWVIGDDAAGVPTQETLNFTDGSYPRAYENIRSVHTKDDALVVAHCPDGDSLVVTYKESGGIWEHYTIHTVGDDGNYKSGGVINTQNNTIVIAANVKISTYLDIYIYIKWPGSDWDDWVSVKIGANRLVADIAVDDSNLIAILGTYTTSTFNIQYWHYNLTTMTRIPDTDNGAATSTATTSFGTVQVLANMTGAFTYFWLNSQTMYFRPLDLSQSAAAIYSSQYYITCFGVLENDRFFGVGHYAHTGRPYIFYQSTHEQGYPWTRTYLEQSGSGCTYESDAISVSIKQNSTVLSIITYCNTDEEIVTWSGNWDYTELQWDGARVHTGVSDVDDVAFIGNFGGLWPRHASTGIRWTRPAGGYAFIARDENGTFDALDYVYDGLSWTVNLMTDDPVITTSSLPNAEYGVFYLHVLAKSNGTAPFNWSILIKPDWMSIGSANGTIYGTPDGTGTEEVRVKLADGVPRYDQRQWTLTIGAGSEGGDADIDPASGICSSGWIAFCVIILMLFVLVGVTADNSL